MSKFKCLQSRPSWQIALLLAAVTGCISSGQVSGVSPVPAPSSSSQSTPATATPAVTPNSANSSGGSNSVPEPTSPGNTSSGNTVAQAPDCDNAQTQVDINQCAAKAAEVADEKLNQVYQQVKSTLSAGEKTLLTDAQLAWIEFRDKNCEFSRSRFEGGSIAPTVYSSCLERITKQRTEELEGYAQGMDAGGIF